MKNIYAVLGMSRTGTSAIARLLMALGVTLGDNLIPADKRNPKGFYEDYDVLYRINRGVSHAVNYQWLWMGTPETDQILSEPRIQSFQKFAVQLVRDRLQAVDCWGFKDPATATLLPFWRSVLAQAHVKENYVIVMRNPLATAYSFQKFVGEDLEVGLLLWLKHMIAAIDGTQGQSRAVIAYERLLQFPRREAERLHRLLSITMPMSDADLDSYANSFLDKSLHHHAFTKEECAEHPAIHFAPLCMQIYELLMRVARDELSLESDEFKQAWQQVKANYAAQLPVYQYVDSLLMDAKQLQRHIRHMRNAWSWKLMTPFRLLEDKLRAYRRVRKEQQRI